MMRKALLNNLKGINETDLMNVLDEGISSQEETILVGLGVLFETYYMSLNKSQKNQFISSLVSLL